MNPLLSLASGIVAAFTPCVAILIPLLLYRFFKKEEKQYFQFGIFIIGFLLSYALVALVLGNLLTSFIQNGIKLGLGLLFMVLGILSLMNKINPLNFPLVKNSFLLGMIFAIIMGVNPCTIPYLAIILTLAKGDMVINTFAFGLGLILPALIFSFLGQKIFSFTKKTGKLFHTINKIMSSLLILAGLYLGFTIKSFGNWDLAITIIILILVFIILLRAFFLIRGKKDLLKPSNIILLTALILILVTAIFHCKSQIMPSTEIHDELSCSYEVTSCEVCMKCLYLFITAVILGLSGVFIANYYDDKTKHKLKQERITNNNN